MTLPHRIRFKRYLDKGITLDKLESLIFEEDHTASRQNDLEFDHTASRQHDLELGGPVSEKAHQRLERNRNAAGIERTKQSSSTKRVMWALRSTAVFLELLAEALWRWSNLLEGKSK